MVADSVITILVSIVGLCVLALAFLAITVRSRGNQAISWSGFGVTFEIKPCATCVGYRRNTNGKS